MIQTLICMPISKRNNRLDHTFFFLAISSQKTLGIQRIAVAVLVWTDTVAPDCKTGVTGGYIAAKFISIQFIVKLGPSHLNLCNIYNLLITLLTYKKT